MDYSVGSLADLISGSDTPNKPKVIKKKFKTISKKSEFNNEAELHQPPILNKCKQTDSLEPHKKKKKVNTNDSVIEDNQDGEFASFLDKKSTENKVVSNAERRVKNKIKEEKQKNNSIHDDRTLFIGNVPLNMNKMKLKKLCQKYGRVDSVRFRCVPLADPRTPKKVAIIKKEFHPDRRSLHSYVKFASKEDAVKALKLNGFKYEDNHLRVNLCSEPEKPDQNKAIFVGNVSFEAEEEDLWNVLESCGPIESVRLVRDRNTNIGKGFGYVNFKSSDAVQLALQMENVVLKGRNLRISACHSSKKLKTKSNKEKNRVDRNQSSKKTKNKKVQRVVVDDGMNDANENAEEKEKNISSGAASQYQGKKFNDKKKKRKFDKGAQQKKIMIKNIAPKG